MTEIRFIGVDPGLNHPAIAVLDERKSILFTTRFNSRPDDPVPKKLHDSTLHFVSFYSGFMSANQDYHVAVELPERQDSIRGQKCIDRNDFVKLCMSAGVLVNLFQGFGRVVKVHLFSPSQWKGQVPKAVTKSRLLGHYGADEIMPLSDDEVDAVALARYLVDHYAP